MQTEERKNMELQSHAINKLKEQFTTSQTRHDRLDVLTNWLILGAGGKIFFKKFKLILIDCLLGYLLWNYPHVSAHTWEVNIGSGKGLMLSGNEPLPEPLMTKIFNAIWYTLPQELKSFITTMCSNNTFLHIFSTKEGNKFCGGSVIRIVISWHKRLMIHTKWTP